MGNVPISYQVNSGYPTAYSEIRSPLTEARYMHNPSCGGFSGIQHIITYFDTLHQWSYAQMQQDWNSDIFTVYEHVRVS